jgi:predicted metalloprotease with PDZ domain
MPRVQVFKPEAFDRPDAPDLNQFNPVLLAEGDSWFTLGAIPAYNLLEGLDFPTFGAVINLAYPGDTVSKMEKALRAGDSQRRVDVWASELGRWIADSAAYPLNAILLSGGGNDLIDAFPHLLKSPCDYAPINADCIPDALDPEALEKFDQFIAASFTGIVNFVRNHGGPNAHVPIFCHTYDFPTPNDAPATILGARIGHSWMYPRLVERNVPSTLWTALADTLVRRLATNLKGLDLPDFHVVNTLDTLARAQLGARGESAGSPKRSATNSDSRRSRRIDPRYTARRPIPLRRTCCAAASMTVHYAIRPAAPGAHLLHVTVTLANPDPAGQRFTLPAWIAGSYLIREFSRHIVRASGLSGSRNVALQKLDKHTWQAEPVRGELTIAYEVYAWDLSVRGAHVDETHAFFNGASVFLLPLGWRDQPCRVDILPPDGRQYAKWKVATGLQPARAATRGTFGTYLAADYDELIDCPVEIGSFERVVFTAYGTPHEVIITGRVPKLDCDRLAADLQRMAEAHIRLFEPHRKRAPFGRYTFLTMAVGDGYGGLEHRNSTALVCRRDDLPYVGMKDTTVAYRTFLGLASHEYFHSWNVKRIRPAAFVPYDLERENYTRLLWVFEGFTSYYDDLMLARARLYSEEQYLEALGKTMTTVMQRSGRLKQSVAESSFDAWIKYYRQDENAPNSLVSYYQKGSLIAAAIDLTLRERTQGRRSLDDVMRLLWRRARSAGAGYRGVGENDLPAVIEEATGVDIGRLVRTWSEGTRDIDFVGLFTPFGIAVERGLALEEPHFALLGIKIRREGADCRIVHVFDGSPAQDAGLSGGDVLVALGGLRVRASNLDGLLSRYAAGDTVEATAFRRDELLHRDVKLATRPPPKFALKVDPQARRPAQQLRRRWLGA